MLRRHEKQYVGAYNGFKVLHQVVYVSKNCRVKPNPYRLHFLFISVLGGTEKVGFAFGQYTARIQAQFQLVLYRWA